MEKIHPTSATAGSCSVPCQGALKAVHGGDVSGKVPLQQSSERVSRKARQEAKPLPTEDTLPLSPAWDSRLSQGILKIKKIKATQTNPHFSADQDFPGYLPLYDIEWWLTLDRMGVIICLPFQEKLRKEADMTHELLSIDVSNHSARFSPWSPHLFVEQYLRDQHGRGCRHWVAVRSFHGPRKGVFQTNDSIMSRVVPTYFAIVNSLLWPRFMTHRTPLYSERGWLNCY